MTIAAKRTRVLREIEPRSASPQRAFGRIEIPQRSSLLPYRGVLSFRSEAREAPGSETARLHRAHRRRSSRVAARGARAAGSIASGRVFELRLAGGRCLHHRGMAAQKATDLRRLLADVEANERALRLRQDELEAHLVAAPAVNWPEAAEKARYLLNLFANSLAAQDPRRQKLIAAVLDDFERLAREV
jgi:hypothetical protein